MLRAVELDAHDPGPGEVRVVVRAAGLNPIDWKIRGGQMAEAMPVQFPVIPGLDLAGVVDRQATGPHAIREHALRAQLPVDEIIPVADAVIVRPDPAPATV